MMESSATTPTLAGLLGYLMGGGAGTFAIMLLGTALLIWHRTKSSHILLTRLWRFFHGKGECKVAVIANILDEQTAIHQFRFTTGIQIRNIQQAARLTTLCKADNETLSKIAAAGKYFDLENLRLLPGDRLPRLLTMWVATMACAVLGWALIAVSAAISLNSALVQVTTSGRWLALNETYAKPFLSGGTGFRVSTCGKPSMPPPDVSGFSAEDATAICKAAGGPDVARLLHDNIAFQRWVLAVVLGGLVYLMGLVYAWLAMAQGAHRLKRYLTANARDSPHPASIAASDG